MSFENWIAFTIAASVLTLIPGPSVLLVVSQAISRGKSAATMCILGDVVGTILLMGLSFLGVGAILAASATLFQMMKWAGVLYLGYLGYRQIVEAHRPIEAPINEDSYSTAWGSFWIGLITAALNPKAVIFYMAFLTQFINPANDVVLQMGILITTSNIVLVVLLTGYALLAIRVRSAFNSATFRKRAGYTSGGLMLSGSVLMAASR